MADQPFIPRNLVRLHQAVTATDLDCPSRMVLLAMGKWINWNTWALYPSYDSIATASGLSIRCVGKRVRTLAKQGLITITKQPGYQNHLIVEIDQIEKRSAITNPGMARAGTPVPRADDAGTVYLGGRHGVPTNQSEITNQENQRGGGEEVAAALLDFGVCRSVAEELSKTVALAMATEAIEWAKRKNKPIGLIVTLLRNGDKPWEHERRLAENQKADTAKQQGDAVTSQRKSPHRSAQPPMAAKFDLDSIMAQAQRGAQCQRI